MLICICAGEYHGESDNMGIYGTPKPYLQGLGRLNIQIIGISALLFTTHNAGLGINSGSGQNHTHGSGRMLYVRKLLPVECSGISKCFVPGDSTYYVQSNPHETYFVRFGINHVVCVCVVRECMRFSFCMGLMLDKFFGWFALSSLGKRLSELIEAQPNTPEKQKLTIIHIFMRT